MTEFTITHPEMVRQLTKTGDQLKAEVTPLEFEMLSEAILATVHMGAILDALKKAVVYRQPLDTVALVQRNRCVVKCLETVELCLEPDTKAEEDCVPPTAMQMELIHAVVGICGEAAELADALLLNLLGQPLDHDNLVEEFGDLEFYMEGARRTLLITRQQTLQANMEKLHKRYPGFNYTDQRAQERADKA